jgi:tetratricopeptide (TPR) repeat protein
VPSPPALQWSSHSEEEWLVGEIARDILEMAVYAKSPSALGQGGLTVGVASLPGAASSYEVTGPVGPADPPFRHRIVLYDHVWASTNYEALARLAIDRLQLKTSAAPAERPGSVATALVDLTPETVERENERVSSRLATDMLSAAAHEEAAFVLGAFALRENAGTFADTRPALCRMSAHLALARALRAPAPPGLDGEYARLIQTTLLGRQSEAVDEIARLRRGRPTPGQRAWLVALAMRNTGDYRLAANPARASALERIEYVRALKRSQGGLKALEFLSSQRAKPSTDWARIALCGRYTPGGPGFTVEEGNVFAPTAIALEMKEWASVSKLLGGEVPQPADMAASLNLAAGRCLWHPEGAGVGPRVIDRGLWTAFAQRHVLSALRETELHLEKAMGLREEAATFREDMTKEFAALSLFPPLQEQWQGRRPVPKPGGAAPALDRERGRCLKALDLVRRRPEVVSAISWQGLDTQCFRARMENALVDPKLWFTTGLPMGTLYDVEHRSYLPALGFSPNEIESLAKLAPYDQTLMYWRVSRHPLESKITQAEFDALYGPVAAYDAKAQRFQATRVEKGDASFLVEAKRVCQANADQCLGVAREMVERGAVNEAVQAYERAVEGARDRVAVSNASDWLVQHYFEEGRTERALEVARLAASVQSAGGLDTLGRLAERMGRYEEAEGAYVALARRYPDQGWRLSAFYVRYERRVGDGRFRAQAGAAEKELFPAGMKRVSIAELRALADRNGPGMSSMGVGIMDVPSKDLQALGLRFQDVVLALDGYRVINQAQYSCILGLTDQPEVTMIVQRQGKEYLELAGKMDRRRYGPREGTRAAPPPSR